MSWTADTICRILRNEKYTGDCLLQKTYTIDCLTHKHAKNNGERPMYLVSDAHPAIIDHDTFNLAQQELTRRNSKRKISSKATTEQGKYSSKYALTELMICAECGTPFRRCTWNVHGKKKIVWRCINRLEHGSRYCKKSPTIHEEPLHRAIVNAINDFYNCGDDAVNILKRNTEIVLNGTAIDEIKAIENRLKEIENARNDFIDLITSGTCGENSLDKEFEDLFTEEQKLCSKLAELKAENTSDPHSDQRSETIRDQLNKTDLRLHNFDNIIVRKLIDCIKVISKTEICIIFKGGYEVNVEVEKK